MIHSLAFLLLLAGQPELGQRGTTFTLAAPTGVNEIVFYTPGLTCSRVEAGKDGTTLHLKAAADCRLGEHAYRLRTASGFGPLATLQITPFPVVAVADEAPTTPAKAQKLRLNVSVAGKLDSEEEAHFAVALTKGQRFAAEVQGVRLGRGPIDLWLRVTGPDGKTITEVDDTSLFRQDPFISLNAPQDGTYLVSVGQSGDGRDQEPYILHVGDFARPVAIFPLGGQAGKKLNVRHLGEKGETEATQEVTLPTTPGTIDLFTQNGPKGTAAPTGQPFRVSAFADVNETADSADASKAPRAERWPVAFNGIITRPDERDHFRFAARKGDVVEFNVFAWRVGSPLDSLIEVYGPDGRLLGQNDDDATHDSRLQVTIEADGDHVVRIRDKRKAGGLLYTYRIEVDRPVPALAAFLPTASRKSQSGNSLAVPRGNRVLAYLGVQRHGDEGAVTLTPGDLPRGVRMTPARIAADEYFTPVVLEADADAPLAGLLVPVTATSDRLKGGFRQVVDLARGPGDSALHSLTVDRLAVAVTNAVPYRVSIIPPTTGLTADGTLEVRVRIDRDKDFTGDLDVTLPLLPHGVEGPIKQTVTGTANEAVFPLVASGELRPGTWPLVAEVRAAKTLVRGDRGTGGAGGMGTGGGRRSRRDGPTAAVASPVVMLPLVAAPITGKIAPVAGELGKTVRVVCTLEGTLPGAMQATLDGLPPRAKASPVSVKPGERSVSFDVTLDPTTPAGKHPTLSVVLAGSRDGSKLSYRVGHGGLLLAAEPGKLAIGKDGKPLSPLEALRAAEKTPGEKAPGKSPGEKP